MTLEDVKAALVADAASARRCAREAEREGDRMTAACMEWSAKSLKLALDMLCEVRPQQDDNPGARRDGWGMKKCERCGRAFMAVRSWQKYCSVECGNAAKAERRRMAEEKRKAAARRTRLDDDSAEARRLGISYGQLQAKRYLEGMKGKSEKRRAV